MIEQPSGTVTLVFTDIEGSTRLLEDLGVDAYRDALADHRRTVRDACVRFEGYEVDFEGDAFFYAFATAQAAVSAVSEAMTRLDGGPIRIRVGIHTGEPALDPPKYVGLDVHRAARIMSAAHGGQVVLSREAAESLDSEVELTDLGEHRFKDIGAPERIYQLGAGQHPPLKSLYRITLPVPATPFLGRERELAAVLERLADPGMRVLTLTGPGGTGKTRLALQSAARASDDFPDGVTWVGLAPLRDPTLVVPAIAQALDLREQSERSPTEVVADALLGKKVLVLVDNAEHLLPEVALQLAELTAACPTLRLLVTSRERLRIAAETMWPVPTLSDADSLDLFTQRARMVRPGFEPTPEVSDICIALDHLPLAIELAAARVGALSPAALLERLGRRLELLRHGSRDAEARQRTLEATISWSYDLLATDEQRALRGLSVFAGGCTLEDAARVAGADLETVEQLLDKSLVRHRLEHNRDRYWMLETIREFAASRLEHCGETDSVVAAYRAHFAAVYGRGWTAARALEDDAVAVLDAEFDNARSAYASAIEHRDLPNAVGLLLGLRLSWARRGLNREALVGARRYLTLERSHAPSELIMEGDAAAAEILWASGDSAEARVLLADCLARARATPSVRLRFRDIEASSRTGALLADIAMVEADEGAFADARAHAAEALEIRRAEGDERGIAHAFNSLAAIETAAGRFDQAIVYVRESLDLLEQLDSPEAPLFYVGLAEAYSRNGDVEVARELLVRHMLDPTITVDAEFRLYALTVAVQALVADGRYADASALASTLETMLEDTGFVLPSWDRKLVAAALAAAEAQHPRGADAPMDPERALEVAWRALAETPGGNVP